MFPPHAHGGYERWARDVARHFAAQGHEILVLTSDVDLGPEVAEAPDHGIEVRRQLTLYWEDHVILDPSLGRRIRIERSNQRALRAAVDEFRPDVVSAWAMGAMSLSLLSMTDEAGLPLVCVVCDEWPSYAPRVDAWTRLFASRPRVGKVTKTLTGLVCQLPDLERADAVCFVSEALRSKVRSSSQWAFSESMIVPSGIDGTDFPVAASGRSQQWGWRLLHVGRADPRKGLHLVVEALAELPEQATLRMLGGGDESYLEELRALAERLTVGARVSFGRCRREELAAHYRAADAVVFAPVWDEPFGLVPLEAMACATPVVASPTGGSSEFLADGDNCVTFASGDVRALVDALTRVAQDTALRVRIVEGGIATAVRFDAGRIADELERVHLDALRL
jgi:glycogen synthase